MHRYRSIDSACPALGRALAACRGESGPHLAGASEQARARVGGSHDHDGGGNRISGRARPVDANVPGGSPLRDAGHVRVLARLRALLPATYRWRTEVPIPITGDRRAIDAMVADPPIAAGFELETRFGDAQSTDRRILIKQRDAGLSAMILVVPDTRHNRLAVAAAAPTIRASFPLDGRQVLRALRAGSPPPPTASSSSEAAGAP